MTENQELHEKQKPGPKPKSQISDQLAFDAVISLSRDFMAKVPMTINQVDYAANLGTFMISMANHIKSIREELSK